MTGWPPGPRGLPVVGNLRQYLRDPLGFLTDCGRHPSDVVGVDLGMRRMCVLTDPADIGVVLSGHGRTYVKATYRDDALDRLLGNGLLLSEGETWRRRRHRLAPAFGSDHLRDVARTAGECTEALLDGWHPGETVDVHAEMTRLAVRLTAATLFGADLDPATTTRLLEALDPVRRRFEPRVLQTVLPDWLPTENRRAYRNAVATIEDVLGGLVRDRRATEGSDVLSTLLGAKRTGEIDDRELRDELVTMLLAGHDTTGLVLTYTWHLLGRAPTAATRLEDEIDAVLGGRRPTAADATALEYLGRVLTESMRLYPPVYSVFRKPLVDVSLGGYRIPAGTPLILSQWIVHRDPRHYAAPAAFDPDRWHPERTAHRHQFAYFPFGGGPRHCIGRRFAEVALPSILGTIVRRYRLAPVSPEPLDLRTSITMRPAGPVRMTVRER